MEKLIQLLEEIAKEDKVLEDLVKAISEFPREKISKRKKYVISSQAFDTPEQALDQLEKYREKGSLDYGAKVYETSSSFTQKLTTYPRMGEEISLVEDE